MTRTEQNIHNFVGMDFFILHFCYSLFLYVEWRKKHTANRESRAGSSTLLETRRPSAIYGKNGDLARLCGSHVESFVASSYVSELRPIHTRAVCVKKDPVFCRSSYVYCPISSRAHRPCKVGKRLHRKKFKQWRYC